MLLCPFNRLCERLTVALATRKLKKFDSDLRDFFVPSKKGNRRTKFVLSLSLKDFVSFLSNLSCAPEKGELILWNGNKSKRERKIGDIYSFFELSREIGPIGANWQLATLRNSNVISSTFNNNSLPNYG